MSILARTLSSRRFRVIILASILTTFLWFLDWNRATRRSPSSTTGHVRAGESIMHEVETTTPLTKFQPQLSPSDPPYGSKLSPGVGNATFLPAPWRYVHAIVEPTDTSFPRLFCPVPTSGRYDHLRTPSPSTIPAPAHDPERSKYFFALNLHQCVHLLPRLLGSVFEAIQFLGPQNCALSIVEGRSDDGTTEVLSTLGGEMDRMGVQYFLESTDINPEEGDKDHRISSLAELRNQALRPLAQLHDKFTLDSTVIFINDVSLCMEDILELIHQRGYQKADMTCAMDWILDGKVFYDVWVSRSMIGNQFFEIPQTEAWDFAENLFWDDPETRALQVASKPYQVFSCWNGATAFTARPLLEGRIRFRSHYPDECFMGEPTHFCKDLWHLGYGKIAVIPSVNVGYDDDQSRHVKSRHGYVSDCVKADKTRGGSRLIKWKKNPPELIKCIPSYQQPSWVPFDQALEQHNNVTAFDRPYV